MQISQEHQHYYVYTALHDKGALTSCGACPVVWEDDVEIQGAQWKKGLNWADGNYHLYDGYGLNEENAEFVENAICKALNEARKTSGHVRVVGTNYEVRWCLLEEEQMRVVMDVLN